MPQIPLLRRDGFFRKEEDGVVSKAIAINHHLKLSTPASTKTENPFKQLKGFSSEKYE